MPEVIEPSIVDDSVADTLETPIEPVEPLEPETPIEPAEPAEPAESQPAPERIADRDVVKWLREQAKTTPDQSKLFDSLRDNYFRAQEFSKLFPEIEQARTLKTHLDAIGGLDGLNELQEVSNDMSELYTQIDSGDPSVIDDIAQNSRDGFLKLVPHALQTLYRVDPRAYDSLITPIITNSVVNSPLVDSISLAAERLQRGETDAALRELTRVLQGFESMRQNGGRQPAAYQGTAQNQGSPPQVANDNGGMHPVAAQILPLVTAHIEQTVHNDVQ
ncbi:MAG: hypothetical protein ACRD22_17610, partial [Terriglobia bacterium]